MSNAPYVLRANADQLSQKTLRLPLLTPSCGFILIARSTENVPPDPPGPFEEVRALHARVRIRRNRSGFCRLLFVGNRYVGGGVPRHWAGGKSRVGNPFPRARTPSCNCGMLREKDIEYPTDLRSASTCDIASATDAPDSPSSR